MILTPTVASLIPRMLDAHILDFRDVKNGEEAFEYSSKNHGPGYLMGKGVVAQRALCKALVYNLAFKVLEVFPDVEYVSGNATGGMVPGWILAEALCEITGREIPYFYVRGTRKIGGHGELLTGDKNNDFFQPGRRGLVHEELVNFAETTSNSAIVQREAGYDVRFAATLMFYDQPKAKELLAQTGLKLIYLLTVEDILSAAEGRFEKRLVDDYRAFLADPVGWQLANGYELPNKEKTDA